MKYEKFKSYKRVFTLLIILSCASSAAGALLCKSTSGIFRLAELSLAVPSAALELLFLLWAFLAGPTIYAPTSAFFASALYSFIIGARWALPHTSLPSLLFEVLFSSVASYLFVIYSSFVTLTGLCIFSGAERDNKRRTFDGVMFRADGFRGIFNFRFVFSYILFFIIFFALISAAVLLKAFIKDIL